MSGGFLIAYDITSPRRLGRMHRYLATVAVPIEYSVFFASGDVRGMLTILAEAAALIDPASDDLRCYPLPGRGLRARLGRATLPEGIHYSALPATLLEMQ
jgi:CRISPR-associated protein Cas2